MNMSPAMKACIEACTTSHREVLHCITHCLHKGGSHAEPGHIGIMTDCAEICAASLNFMLRDSRHAPHLCRECAEICTQCAESCANHPDADDHMRQCAEACRRCAEACRAMAA
ncbi:four-helix bundle copper-binding protein [Roseomonas elaeocarpi]|uniref:Four-helix bundle copper-binding protein n=1 Tax=Roseomonas elaeocarpi TaxID=907779 RepID=A0ABV6JQ05_9PROT